MARITSLRHTVEKLLEAEHFLLRLADAQSPLLLQFELNAFLSAARSVSLVLQKDMSSVSDFAAWYATEQERMRSDQAMRYFTELRNVSQKQGPVGIVFGGRLDGAWGCQFAGNEKAVPESLRGRDVCDSARQHLWKLVQLVDNCRERFPYNACPAKAFTDDGMRALGLDWSDLEIAIGLPVGWTDVAPPDGQARMAFLRREIEPLDSLALERLLAWCSSSSQERRDDSFLGDLVSEVEQRGEGAAPRDLFLRTIMKRIERIENGED